MTSKMVTKAARATEQPCQLYTRHIPKVVRTDGHHRHPIYLQNRVYGQLRDTELLWVCGSCHDAIHAYLSWMLGEAEQPSPMPGYNAIREAKYSYAWYVQAQKNVPTTP